ncbi:hypothetical protein Glove_374g16 [Diversispora epigaea]|uniref:Uncharacterized protein n=1 Tax=Diversispora epigaea TaxID=1348612 RepID=A0A397H8L9_9GLOM|nr:hypothetical protein Glove_374g16 [Diversispora epigaea]
MTLPKSTQKITDKLEQKNEYLDHKDVKVHFKPHDDKCKLHSFSFEFAENSDSNPTSIIRNDISSHGFVSAIIHAYNLHQHLRLSPDDVWLTVAQGVSKHILDNSERFRYLFVNHKGKEDIKIFADDILSYVNGNYFKGDWPQVIARLSGATDKKIKKVGLKQHLECDFSTSTSASITASQIILLNAMKNYFRYKVMLGCGIPKVTLDGTLEDWLHLQEKVAKIRDLGLELDFWLDRLEPVINQFVSTYKGDVDEKFWSMTVFNVPYGSGGQKNHYWNGWIGALFPYDNSGNKIMKNEIDPDEVPSGLVHVPFEVILNNISSKLNFVAGFFGARQDKVNEEYVVSPVIGWYVVDKSENWLHLQEKVAKIRDLGLELDFWLDRLEPVINQFVSTYKGDVDEKFWSMTVFNVPYGSGGQKNHYWNGWIGALFPYDNSGNKIMKNEIDPDEVPSGLVHVPFEVILNNISSKLNFVAGFFGARQDKVNEEYVVSPVIGWYVVDKSESNKYSPF